MSQDFFEVECPVCHRVVWGNVFGRIRHHDGCDNTRYEPASIKPSPSKRIIPYQSRTLERRLSFLIHQGRLQVTADDITDEGRIAIDGEHSPNGKQSGIGSFIRQMAEIGVLLPSELPPVRSKAPKRKGGAIRVWLVGEKSKAWARQYPRCNGSELSH